MNIIKTIVEKNARKYGLCYEPILPDSHIEAAMKEGSETNKLYADDLRCLAKQLGFPNDFYYSLIGAADLLENQDQP